MGGTGRSKRRKREEEHGTGLEHAGVSQLSVGGGQRDRVRRRRLAYKLEKQGQDLTESKELSALVARQRRQRKLTNKKERSEKKGQKPAENQNSGDDTGDEDDDDEAPVAPFSDENAKWLKLKDNKKSSKPVRKGPKMVIRKTKPMAEKEPEDKNDEEMDDVEDNEESDDNDTDKEDDNPARKSKKSSGKVKNDEEEGSDDNEEDGDDDDVEEEDGDDVDTEEEEEENDDDDDDGDDDDDDMETEDPPSVGNMLSDEDDDMEESEDDGDLPPDKLEIASAKILEEREQEEADAEAEQADDRERADAGFSDFKLDTGLLGRGGQDSVETPATRDELLITIRGILHVLNDFKTRHEEGKSRSEYVEVLKQAISECFEYNEELTEMLMEIFPNGAVIDFMEASEKPRPLTIRTNTLKIKRRDLAQLLISRGMNVDPIDKWSKVGLVIYESQVPVGATPEYLAGYYMIQSASSFLPVVALAPREDERVLDMAAAPGGKTSYIGSVMKNKGVLVANDAKRERIKSLVANLHRLGITNSVVSNYDGRLLPKVFGGGSCFDRVLLDAPCSGTGVICHDAGVKTNRTKDDVRSTVKLQKELLVAAIDCVSERSKTGGYVVYSTCSVLVEENEEVVEYALQNRHVKIVDPGIGFGVSGFTKMGMKRFHKDMVQARRIYPHVHNLDGFFVCKLKKMASGKKGAKSQKNKDDDDDDDDDDDNQN